MNEQLDRAERLLHRIIRQGGMIAKCYFEEGVSHTIKSSMDDLLTVADMEVSEFLVDRIRREFPEHTIYSEELSEDINSGGEYRWVIDPIDGTRNFAMGVPAWCPMVALEGPEGILLGAVYNPFTDQVFIARKGRGCTVNGRILRVNSVSTMERTQGVIIFDNRKPRSDLFRRFTHEFFEISGWLIHQGTMLSITSVASGGLSFLVSNCGLDHDYMAPAILASEAGALVTDVDGNPWRAGERSIVIANPVLHPEILRILHSSPSEATPY